MEVSTLAQKANYIKAANDSLNLLLNRTDIGFHQLAENHVLWDQSSKTVPDWSKKFKHFVWIGIGGSSLGPKSMASAWEMSNIDFVENPDIKALRKLKAKIKPILAVVGFVFVSKSGNTIETLMLLDYFRNELSEQNLKIHDQSLVITELKKSSLFDWAKKFGVPVLEVPFDVGGRFSVLSSIGQAITLIAEKDLDLFRNGARQALTENYKINTLLPLISFFIEGLEKKDVLTYFWYYSDSAYQLGKWLEQLWAESLAKKVSNSHLRSSVPIIVLGANDQHSILQQMMDSEYSKSIVVNRFLDENLKKESLVESQFVETKLLEKKDLDFLLQTEAKAMTASQKEIGNNVIEFKFKHLNEFEIGLYFMTYKLVVATLGEYMQINAYDQPGVELGKVLTKKMLSERVINN